MLGTRGVRLGILKADLYKMQVRSIVGAARHRAQAVSSSGPVKSSPT